ncbi:MAG TPA: hypothetical protein VL137_05580, partial [Polyangiaceae bacterium]|nr:hypothetical protein [Polyangiaceae bacterium]
QLTNTAHVKDLDRKSAIERAIASAQAGDLVLLAGKGHETYQIIGTQRTDFDDRQQACEALRRRRAREGVRG